ncbi:MAG: SDR family NAD(P)-dependent oxidoreductase [Halioglobus sp.]
MNKTIVITGASAGIGRALAQECFKRGYHLGLTGRRMEALETLRNELLASLPKSHQRIEIISLDVDASDTVAPILHTLFERLGGVDIVVVNAGINEYTRIGRGNFDKERHVLQTNLIGGIATMTPQPGTSLARAADISSGYPRWPRSRACQHRAPSALAKPVFPCTWTAHASSSSATTSA